MCKIKNKFLLLINIIIVIICFTACGKDDGTSKTFRFDVKSPTSNIDPQFSSSNTSKIIIQNTFEGLFGYDKNGALKNVIAESYDISNNQTKYTFNIKDNSKWSNGDSVTAYDFEFAFKRMFNYQAFSPFAANYISIKNANKILKQEMSNDFLGVKAIDDKTLIIELEEPNPYFLALLADNASMPCNKKFLTESKGRYGLDLSSIIFNGAFYVKSWDKKTISLRKNKYYSDFNNITATGVNFYIGRENPIEIFKKEQSDCIFLNYEELNEIGDKFNLTSFDNTNWVLAFNQKTDLFANENIRLAFSSSICNYSPTLLTDENYSAEKNLISKTSNVNSGSYRNLAGDLNYNAISALDYKNLLDIGLKELNLKKLPKTTLLLPDNKIGHSLAQELQSIWAKQLSVYINFEFAPIADLINQTSKLNYQIALLPITAENDSPITTLTQFTSQNQKNYFGINDTQLDSIIYTATHSTGEVNSVKLIKSAEQYILDKGYVIPMYASKEYFASLNNVSDIDISMFEKSCYFKYAKRFD